MTESLLLSLLPDVIAASAPGSAPLRAVVGAADDLHDPVHRMLDRIDSVVDPYRVPEQLVPYLAGWVDLDWLSVQDAGAGAGAGADVALGVSSARQRDLIANAADLSATRGTPQGLRRFLELATGHTGFEIVTGERDFHVLVRVPTDAADSLELVERIVTVLKPAHVTSEVAVGVPSGGVPDA